MLDSLKFIGWKILEGVLFVLGFPFFFLGAWLFDFSDRAHEKAAPYHPRSRSK